MKTATQTFFRRRKSNQARTIAIRSLVLAFVALAVSARVAEFEARADAHDVSGAFEAIGQGTVSCGKWTEARQQDHDSAEAVILSSWINGFISGVNWRGAEIQNVAWGTDRAARDGWIDNYCAAYPLDLVVTATVGLINELEGRAAH